MFYKDNAFKRNCIGTRYKFIWIPKRCHISKKRLWLKYGYVQTALWTGPGDDIYEDRWYDKNEFLIAKIKDAV